MGNICLMTVKELKSYFFSFMGYVIWALFLLIQGFVFWFLVNAYSNPQSSFNEPLNHYFFGTFYFWFLLLIIPPLLTMRSLAEEKRSGTIDLLTSAPVNESQIVIAKFLAAFLFFCVMWVSTIFHFFLISSHTELDWIQILNGYLGAMLVTSVFIAVGIFASALTSSQILSAIVAFSFGLMLFSLGFLDYFISLPKFSAIFEYINIMNNMEKFSQGLLDTRPIVYFVSLTCLFLVLSTSVLDTRRWS